MYSRSGIPVRTAKTVAELYLHRFDFAYPMLAALTTYQFFIVIQAR